MLSEKSNTKIDASSTGCVCPMEYAKLFFLRHSFYLKELKYMRMFCEECQIWITFNDKIIYFKQNLLLSLTIIVMLAVKKYFGGKFLSTASDIV